MSQPVLSNHFNNRKPSPIRIAQIQHAKRTDDTEALNVAIGNVSLPMHPSMIERMFNLSSNTSPFKNGVVKYSSTVGIKEANDAILRILESSSIDTSNLFSQITEGGSHAMELIILGVCGEAGVDEKPLLVFDPAYSNYTSMAERLGRNLISIERKLNNQGFFEVPELSDIEKLIIKENPGAVLIIAYDNPTGQLYTYEYLKELAELAVKYNLWIISDESYRELHYKGDEGVSIWKFSEDEVPGINSRRISIESASKVWNACGLRIGAIVTDSKEFHEKCVAENTANLCPNVIGQYIFGALAHESKDSLQKWYEEQRSYYQEIGNNLITSFENLMPELVISKPEASIYLVVDVRNLVKEDFDTNDFVLYCAQSGKVEVDGKNMTLLVAPMDGFYQNKANGRTQMRIAFVEKPEKMQLVPVLFKKLLEQYLAL